MPPGSGTAPVAPAVWRDGNGRACAYAYAAEEALTLHLPGVGWYRVDATPERVTAYRDPHAADDDVVRAFHSAVLPLYLSRRGFEVLHAGAVCDSGGVTGFCATSGTGKTTLLHALTARGLAAWADDALLIAPGAGGAPTTLALPPHGSSRPGTPDVGTAAPLRHLVLLERHHRRERTPTLERIAPAAAFTALLPHAYCLDLDSADRKRAMVERYLELCAQVPVWTLRYASGLQRLPRAIELLNSKLGLGDGEQ
jgi:hypothetical protein